MISLKLPTSFDEAIKYAEERNVVLPAEFYKQIPDSEKGKAFTVSYLAGLDQVKSVFDNLNESIKNGGTFEQWKKNLPDFGLKDSHLETVFRNFMQNSYNAGRWAQIEKNKANMPYLMFVAIDDARTTRSCRLRNRIIRKVDDPFWNKNSPPCHHRCRSTLIALTGKQANKYSLGEKEGLNKPVPDEKLNNGFGYKPTMDQEGKGLVIAITNSLKDAPKPMIPGIIGVFVGLWEGLTKWITNLIA